jgi:hypothetical protein
MIKQLSSHPFQVVNKCLVLTFHIVAKLVQDYFWICSWNILVRYCISWSMPGTCHCAWWGAYDVPSRASLNFQMGRKMGTMACTHALHYIMVFVDLHNSHTTQLRWGSLKTCPWCFVRGLQIAAEKTTWKPLHNVKNIALWYYSSWTLTSEMFVGRWQCIQWYKFYKSQRVNMWFNQLQPQYAAACSFSLQSTKALR